MRLQAVGKAPEACANRFAPSGKDDSSGWIKDSDRVIGE